MFHQEFRLFAPYDIRASSLGSSHLRVTYRAGLYQDWCYTIKTLTPMMMTMTLWIPSVYFQFDSRSFQLCYIFLHRVTFGYTIVLHIVTLVSFQLHCHTNVCYILFNCCITFCHRESVTLLTLQCVQVWVIFWECGPGSSRK